MLRLRYIAAIILIEALSCGMLSAQLRTLPTREQLESVANPKLSTAANRGISATCNTIELGEIDGTKRVDVEFTLCNTTNQSVTITEYRSMCGCLKVATKPSTLRAGESTTLHATLTPSGRGGEFERRILVYTSLDERHPTERLTVSYRLTSDDRFSHLPHHMGTLRLSRKDVVMDNLKVGARRSERIVIANAGEREVTLHAKPTIEGLGFEMRPATLKPGEEGEIIIGYTTQRLPEQSLETLLLVEGCEARPTERMIKITIKR